MTERLTVRTADCVSVSPLYGRLQSGCGAAFFMQLLLKIRENTGWDAEIRELGEESERAVERGMEI